MAELGLSPRAISALTGRELEILRMLAAGHTAKSIAVCLDCSETAINERLRDARRKTGIGSSRELARLLDARKIWDKNIDLPSPDQTQDSGTASASAGRKRTKGTRIMLLAIPAAAVALTLVTTGSAPHRAGLQTAQAAAMNRQPPLVGSWSLDVARIPEAERPQRVTMTFRHTSEGKWTTLVEIVAADGTATHGESTAAPDGVPVPVSGNMGFLDTVALRQPAPNTLVMTLGKNGAPLSTRVYAVSKDRKSMTETIVWAGSTLPGLETTRFNRID